jgi:hypothetical protein
MREAAVAVLGRQASAEAVEALVALIQPSAMAFVGLDGDAACALGRSPAPGALGAIEAMASAPATRRLAVRAYFVRRYVRGERSARLDALLETLATAVDPVDRAAATQALVALGERALAVALADRDPRVRRAAAMGALARPEAWSNVALAARSASETDEATREVLASGWTNGDGDSSVATSFLVERAGSGGPDAPLAAFALARRSDDEPSAEVERLLGSPDALLRAHAARGLGASASRSATGRLTAAYAWEEDPGVRRAILEALAARVPGRGDEAARRVFDLAARLDPDAVARWIAARAELGSGRTERAGGPREIAWLRLIPGETAPAIVGATALLATSDGRAIPIAFDDDGYALVPGVSPGEARLRLAPRLPSYSPPHP